MAFLNLKKEKIPDELPELDIDELEKNFLHPEKENPVKRSYPALKKELIIQEAPISREAKEIEESIRKIKESVGRKNSNSDLVERKYFDEEKTIYKGEYKKKEIENSYFKKLYQDINKEIENIDELDEWYKKKFFAEDVVSDMKKYWASQKNDLIIKEIGKNYKESINQKIDGLKSLEADWQEIYLKLIQKEVEMRKKEDELKKILSEFVDSCKEKANIKNEE